MPGFLTSYAGLFSSPETDAPRVTSIEIPLIQRDYAQGRTDPQASDIRERFLDVLYEALTEGRDVGLDFIYGDVEDGTLRPLDGQQRLTTLFLLHWYLGYRAEQLSERQAWMSFSYATRPSARLFCERLVTAQPPPDESAPAAWIVDQPWFLYVWRNDPTIQAMLVMIRAIHRRFADCDVRSAWQRLIASNAPAITFQLLPIDDMGSGEDLYIKMNSRGKPLTPFENFKALFERAIGWAGDRATEFDHRIDGSWSDILWRLRGYDDIVDDKFLRYFQFITDVCQWRAGQLPGGVRLETRALRLFGTAGRQAEESMEFLFHAFDTWPAPTSATNSGSSSPQTAPIWPATPTGCSCSERKPAPTCSRRAASTTALRGSPTAAHFFCWRCSWTAPAPPRNSLGGSGCCAT